VGKLMPSAFQLLFSIPVDLDPALQRIVVENLRTEGAGDRRLSDN
jgi:hypothetical protein